MHLTGYLKSCGFDVAQRDLSIKVVRDVLLEYGDETTGELLEFLGGPAPVEAKRGASEAIDELAIWIRDNVDPDFGFSRYAEHLCRAVTDFGELERSRSEGTARAEQRPCPDIFLIDLNHCCSPILQAPARTDPLSARHCGISSCFP